MKKINLLIAFILFCTISIVAQNINYYVSNIGNDLNDGTSADFSWSSLVKVNSFEFQPGDSVLFRCGDVWRGQIKAKSGNNSGVVYYGSYGNGNKPLFLGSVNLSNEDVWQNTEPNIWSTQNFDVQDIELLENNSFDIDASNWTFHTQDAAIATGNRTITDFYSSPASFQILCTSAGINPWEIQLANHNISIEDGITYMLSFYAKSNQALTLNSVLLMQSEAPYQIFFEGNPSTVSIGTEWNNYHLFFTSIVTVNDAMINFILGGILPDNSEILIDDVSLREVSLNLPITTDVGNLIFNDGGDFGVKKWHFEDLDMQGDFWFDNNNLSVNIFSEINPALYYDNIEAGLTKNIVDYEDVSYCSFENLEINYGSAHGFGGGNTNNISIINCDISYIGGGAIYITDHGYIRYGNGIEFWANASNNIVEKCRISQVYDAAITNQNAGSVAVQSNIIYRNNVISNSEWSFEHWNRPTESVTSNIYFINNTCLYAGDTWAKNQRDFDPTIRGSHLTFFQTEAQTTDFYIMNNIFYESESTILYSLRAEDLDLFNFGNNCWQQTVTDTIVKIYYDVNNPPYLDLAYMNNQFSQFQSNYNIETGSILLDPDFLNESESNYSLNYNSPCIDAGYNETVDLPVGDFDFLGNPRIIPGFGMPPAAIDIGAFEYDFYSAFSDDFENENDITFWPNPFTDFIFLQSNNFIETIVIFDFTGKIRAKYETNSDKIQLNNNSLSQGIYLFEIRTKDSTYFIKAVKN